MKNKSSSLIRIKLTTVALAVCSCPTVPQRIKWKYTINRKHRITIFYNNQSISFTLYPAHSRVGRGNLVSRHSVPHFLPNSEGIACWVAERNAVLWLDTRAKKRKYKFKQVFHLLEWGLNPQPVDLQSHFVPLRHDWAQLGLLFYLFYYNIHTNQGK